MVWVIAGATAAVGAAVFAVPEELQVAHLYELRRFQAKLRHYQTFVPERCDEALPAYRDLRLEVARATSELAIVSKDIGRCLEHVPEGMEARTRLSEARSMYADSLAAFADFRPSLASRIGVVVGSRRAYSRGEHAEAHLRQAEVERRLAFFGDPVPMLTRAKQHIRQALVLSSGDPILAGVAANNLGNVLNHLYLLRRPDSILEQLGVADGPAPLALLEQALRSYAQAVTLLESAPELRSRAQVNLAIQNLIVAAAYSVPSTTDDESRRMRIAGNLEAAQRLFGGAYTPETGEAYDGLLKPNYALALGVATARDADGKVPPRPFSYLLNSQSTETHSVPSSAQGLQFLQSAERIYLSAREGTIFSIESSLGESLVQFAAAIDQFAERKTNVDFSRQEAAEREEAEVFPLEHRAALVGKGTAQVELAVISSDPALLDQGIESLQKSLELAQLDGRQLRLDVKDRSWGPFLRAPRGSARAASSHALEALAIVNLWRACLFRAAYEDSESQLALGDELAWYIAADAYSWERQLDPVFARSVAAIQLGVRWQYGARRSDASYLGRAFSAVMDARRPGGAGQSDLAWRF